MGKALLVVAILALVIYLTIRLIEKRRGIPARRTPRSPLQPPRRAVAPDDDPEFLRDLEQKRRREKRDRDRDEPHPEADSN